MVFGTSARLTTTFNSSLNFRRQIRRRQWQRQRQRQRTLDCSALFDGLFGKQKQQATTTATTTTTTTASAPSTTEKASSSSPSPALKFPDPPPTAEDGSALPPPYEEAVLLSRPCPSGDGGTVFLVFCVGGGGDGNGGSEEEEEEKSNRSSVKVDAGALEALCDAVGWPRRPADAVEAALAGSFVVASLVARKVSAAADLSADSADDLLPPPPPPSSKTDQLVGLARATSDRAFNATIWDVLVHPEWQGLGLGSALVERTTGALLRAGVGNVTLFAASDAVEFYEALGYEADPDGIRGMFYAGK